MNNIGIGKKNTEETKKQILEAFEFRHACKEFDPNKKIAKEDFEFILETARLSPSSIGLEPWKFVIVQNPEIREKLRAISWGAQRQLPTASHFVIILARTIEDLRYDSDYVSNILQHHYPKEIIGRLTDANRNFQESSFKLLESDRAMFDWACKQTYIALANMMTAAAQIGIDSCPIEGFDRDKVEQLLREEGILTDNRFGVSCFAAFGYRAHDPRPKSRQPMDNIVIWNN